ncbi:universal stress protein [Nitrosopumilus sp.]|uniref:universal stress protein n=1 Tax=Nitrosopumilus sp. TaxID=2024843 RepID=UPI0034A078D0
MSFKEVLVAYDASSFSDRAFRKALDIADPKSNITVLTVITGMYQPSIGFSMKLNKDLLEKQNKVLKKIFLKLQAIAKKKEIKLSLKIIQGNSVSNTIIKYVNSHKYDLIVIGSHGRTGLNKLILGSVANSVAQQVKCAAMVVK